MTELTQYCPICQQAVKPNPRYPAYICMECSAQATDFAGRSVSCFDGYHSEKVVKDGKETTSVYADGVVCAYTDELGVRYDGDLWIKGHKCIAHEARFGGVVYMLATDPDYGTPE